MKNKRLLGILTLCLVLLLCLSGCRTYGIWDDDFKGGETITPEILQDIQAELFQTATDTVADTQTKEAVTLAEDAVVYWLAGGSVYHAYRDCYHLSQSEEVSEGRVADALADGKEKLCSNCDKKLNR